MKTLIKSILSSFAFLLFIQTTFAKEIRFIQITDVLFNGSEKSVNTFNQALRSINSMQKIDFVVFTGNNVEGTDEANLKNFFKSAKKINKPVYFLIGYKEVYKSQNMDKSEYIKILLLNNNLFHPYKTNFSFNKGGIEFVAIDGVKEVIPGPSPYYTIKTLSWLDNKLTRSKNKKVVLLQHFPYITPTYNACDKFPNSNEYKAVIEKHNNIIAVVAGQRDKNEEILNNGIYYITTPSMSGSTPVFKLIEIEKIKSEYMIYTQLIPLSETVK